MSMSPEEVASLEAELDDLRPLFEKAITELNITMQDGFEYPTISLLAGLTVRETPVLEHLRGVREILECDHLDGELAFLATAMFLFGFNAGVVRISPKTRPRLS